MSLLYCDKCGDSFNTAAHFIEHRNRSHVTNSLPEDQLLAIVAAGILGPAMSSYKDTSEDLAGRLRVVCLEQARLLIDEVRKSK